MLTKTDKTTHNLQKLPANIFVVNKFSEEDLPDAFPGNYEVVSNCLLEGTWQLLDTYDQELRAADQLLFRQEKSLILFQPDTGIVKQSDCRENWAFINELTPGPVKRCLRRINPLRACLPLAEIPLTYGEHQILDDQQKTVCRLRSLRLQLHQDAESITIVDLEGLRGYKKALRLVRSVLAKLPTQTSGKEMHSVWSALCPDQTALSKKYDVAIDPQNTAMQVKIDLIGFYLANARANEAGIIADWDTEFVHDYRVSLRKVRSVLSLFKGVFSDEVTRSLKSRFADIMKTTNRLRDLDVYLLDKPDYLALVPKPMRPGLNKMFAEFSRERKKQLNLVRQKLASEEYLHTMEIFGQQFPPFSEPRTPPKIATPLGPSAMKPVGEYASTLIYKRYRKIRKLARLIDDQTPDEEIHELRIEFKKIRYLMEFFATLYPVDELRDLLKAMKSLQSSLGRFNDFSVQQSSLNAVVELQKKGKRKADMDIVRSIGALLAAIDAKQLAARHEIVANLGDFISKETRMTFEGLFHSPVTDEKSQLQNNQDSGETNDGVNSIHSKTSGTG